MTKLMQAGSFACTCFTASLVYIALYSESRDTSATWPHQRAHGDSVLLFQTTALADAGARSKLSSKGSLGASLTSNATFGEGSHPAAAKEMATTKIDGGGTMAVKTRSWWKVTTDVGELGAAHGLFARNSSSKLVVGVSAVVILVCVFCMAPVMFASQRASDKEARTMQTMAPRPVKLSPQTKSVQSVAAMTNASNNSRGSTLSQSSLAETLQARSTVTRSGGGAELGVYDAYSASASPPASNSLMRPGSGHNMPPPQIPLICPQLPLPSTDA